MTGKTTSLLPYHLPNNICGKLCQLRVVIVRQSSIQMPKSWKIHILPYTVVYITDVLKQIML